MLTEKQYNLSESKVFCMLPWVHIHSLPNGNVSPCCISYPSEFTGAVEENSSLIDLVNSVKQSALRVDMLNDKPSKICDQCYQSENLGQYSFRQQVNRSYEQYYQESVELGTDAQGRLNNFKMRYFDFRFDNICNFKCRSCTQDYSSQWEQENKRYKADYIPIRQVKSKRLFKDIIDQIENLHEAYFAGGEPLITEEHYILLESMIKQGRTDIILRYNTNLSNFKFKDKDIIGLWKQFEHPIQIGASIDHYGTRAEYIRHGTDWDKIQANIFLLKEELPGKLYFNICSVLSVYNVLSMYDFFDYMISNKLYDPNTDGTFQLYHLSHPSYLSAHLLPVEDKHRAVEQFYKLIEYFRPIVIHENRFNEIEQRLLDTINFLNDSKNNSKYLPQFIQETKRLDTIRKENFAQAFPELQRFIQ